MKMFGGMFVLGVVTTADMAARLTNTQMNPGVARLQALFTPRGTGGYGAYFAEVGTVCCHKIVLLDYWAKLLRSNPYAEN